MSISVIDQRTDTVADNSLYRYKSRMHYVYAIFNGIKICLGSYWVSVGDNEWVSEVEASLCMLKNRIKLDLSVSQLKWFFNYNLFPAFCRTPNDIINYMKLNDYSFSSLIAGPVASSSDLPILFVKAEIKEKTQSFNLNFIDKPQYDDFMIQCRSLRSAAAVEI